MDQALSSNPVPKLTGIGLRSVYYTEIIATKPDIPWFEIHMENLFAAGGKPWHFVETIRQDYPISLHGVDLSLGSSDPLSKAHLKKLRQIIQRIQPKFVSEHLCWCSIQNQYLHDLLPLPRNRETLRHVAERIYQVQDFLQQSILIENISSYVDFTASNIPEWEFLVRIATTAGCGILLDVNNIYVNSINHQFDPQRYIDAIPRYLVKEIHLAGFREDEVNGKKVLIDTHDHYVSDAVWDLYCYAIRRFGRIPTLIEWDANFPPLTNLLAEAQRAEAILEEAHVNFAAATNPVC